MKLGKLLDPDRKLRVSNAPIKMNPGPQDLLDKASILHNLGPPTTRLFGELYKLVESVRPPRVLSPEAQERIRLDRERKQRNRFALGAAIADAIGQAVTELPAGGVGDPDPIGAAIRKMTNDKRSPAGKTLGRRIDAIFERNREERERDKKK
ncbi:MAG: hypothetical protein JST92_03875 [Deltaproteobacteria bacterium]|nr:hypothetical protein [Deltaproteobacteria bacterium]